LFTRLEKVITTIHPVRREKDMEYKGILNYAEEVGDIIVH